MAAEGGGLRCRREPEHLPREPFADRKPKPLSERFLELEGDRALAESELLARESLAREGAGVACARASDAGRDQQHSRGRQHAHNDRESVHAIFVILRMMMFPMASRPAEMPIITHPSGLVNMGRK